jgi:FtsH-binding integral membrane protein
MSSKNSPPNYKLSSSLSSRMSSRLSFQPKSIANSNVLLKIFCTLVIIVLICIAIGHYAFKNGLLTCEHYVFNTYLYIILAIMLMFLVVLLNDQYGIFNSLLMMMFSNGLGTAILSFIILLILLIGLTYALIKFDPTNIALCNGIWLALVLLIGILLIPTIYLGRMTDVVGLAGILTIVIVIVVGLLGYYLGDKIITFDWDYYLNIALIILIIVAIIGGIFISILMRDINTLLTFMYVISIISLVIFVLLLLSNHKKLRENSDKCIDGQVIPNYPLESWRLVIKIVKIFGDLIRIFAIRKLRRR